MISALLIDLDDTLLGNDIDVFLPAYLDRLGKHLDSLIPADRMLRALLGGTRAMIENRDPERILSDVFDAYFYPRLETTEAALRPTLEEFYATQFPELRGLTQALPSAPALVKGALQLGLEVVVATKPIFPRTANEQRLAWAGASAYEFPYTLITSYDTVHFSKPLPAYFAEVLGRLGKAPHEAAMIGNDLEDDILPARSLGMPVFYIGKATDGQFPSGNLDQALGWLPVAEEQADRRASRQPGAILALLSGNVAALLGLTKGLKDAAWGTRPADGEWAPVEIVCHLRDVEIEVNLPRLQILQEQTSPFVSADDTDPWVAERDYLTRSGPAALAAFVEARKQTIAQLESLSAEEWARPARHALLGPTTLAELMAVVCDHDRLHLAKIRRALPPAPGNPPLQPPGRTI